LGENVGHGPAVCSTVKYDGNPNEEPINNQEHCHLHHLPEVKLCATSDNRNGQKKITGPA